MAQDALELTAEGRVLLRLRRPWRDGTRAIRFEPSELLEKLAALVPRPRANLLLYHGAFAARGCWRVARATAPRAQRSSAPAASSPAAGAGSPPSAPPSSGEAVAPGGPRPPPPPVGYVRPRHVAWAELLQRTFALDVLACPDCGGRLRLVATITDPRVIARILALPGTAAGAAVPRAAAPTELAAWGRALSAAPPCATRIVAPLPACARHSPALPTGPRQPPAGPLRGARFARACASRQGADPGSAVPGPGRRHVRYSAVM